MLQQQNEKILWRDLHDRFRKELFLQGFSFVPRVPHLSGMVFSVCIAFIILPVEAILTRLPLLGGLVAGERVSARLLSSVILKALSNDKR
jgi:hypothetical protein